MTSLGAELRPVLAGIASRVQFLGQRNDVPVTTGAVGGNGANLMGGGLQSSEHLGEVCG